MRQIRGKPGERFCLPGVDKWARAMQSENSGPYQSSDNFNAYSQPASPAGVSPQQQPPGGGKAGMPWWGWLLLVVILLPVTCCGLSIFSLAILGTVTPDNGVYSDQTLPQKYYDIVVEVGALEEGEQIQFLYSDALVDMREGFYFVSDRRVVTYIQAAAVNPLKSVRFEDIDDIEFDATDSAFDVSYVTIYHADGIMDFPLSNFNDGDERFVEAIKRGVKSARSSDATDRSPDPPAATADWDS